VTPLPTDPLGWAEGWLPEDDALRAARARAAELGVQTIDPLTGSALRFLAAVTNARAVAEVGTGTGVSGLWLLRGMTGEGILTSIDAEAEHQRLAREVFVEAGIPAARARLIAGRALEVLPRLADGAYDLVHADADPADVPDLLPEMVRTVRVGGVVVISHAMNGGRVADPAARDAATLALREAGRAVREREDLLPVLLPVGDGVIAATRRAGA
jgi:predicted O-methyltransferase YrrM